MARRNQSGVLAAKSGSVRVYRGSHKRVKRVTLSGNWSPDLLVAALTIFLTLLLLIPSLARNAADSH
jgi:energy-coupling factor transporter transmembrane protein EcfT